MEAPLAEQRAVALRHGAGIFAGFVLVSLTNAIGVAAAVPAPKTWLLGVARHAFQIGETIGLGALVAIAIAVPLAVAPRSLGRARAPVGIALYTLCSALVLHVALKEYTERRVSLLL